MRGDVRDRERITSVLYIFRHSCGVHSEGSATSLIDVSLMQHGNRVGGTGILSSR